MTSSCPIDFSLGVESVSPLSSSGSPKIAMPGSESLLVRCGGNEVTKQERGGGTREEGRWRKAEEKEEEEGRGGEPKEEVKEEEEGG